MKSKMFIRKIYLASIVCLLVGGLLFGTVAPALAWRRVNKHAYHFWAHNNTRVDVNDAMVWGTIRGWWPSTRWQPPHLQAAWSSAWPFTGTGTIGIWRWVKFADYSRWLPPSSVVWFNVDFFAPRHKRGVTVSTAWFRWTVNSSPVGPWRWLGWRVGSTPALFNPPERPDGTPNTNYLVVTDLQFAMSPTRIPNDQTILGDPQVEAAFAASLDPVRPGPIGVAPNSFFDVFTPPIHPSITEPVVGGSTVLVRGTVEDESGEPRPFVVQFIAEKEPPPTGVNTYWLAALALLAMAMGLVVMKRARFLRA